MDEEEVGDEEGMGDEEPFFILSGSCILTCFNAVLEIA
jgi:hypothetical protein